MTISVGERLPQVKLTKMTAEGPEPVDTGDYFKGKRVALFAVPGAFTPTCSAKHLPGFVDKDADLKAKGMTFVEVDQAAFAEKARQPVIDSVDAEIRPTVEELFAR